MSTPDAGATAWCASRDEGLRHLREADYEAAKRTLTAAIRGDASGESEALLALAHFQQGEYAAAAEHYAAALEREPGNADWDHMLALARANATAEVNVPVPDLHHFERDALLAPSVVPPGTLPATPASSSRRGLGREMRRMLGSVLGSVISVAFTGLTHLVGRLAGYRDEVWTNWYRRPFALGILTLAYMRDRLNKHNLKSTYPEDALVGFQAKDLEPPEGVKYYRTADGSWNNLCDPKEGAAGTRFPRNVANCAIHPETDETLLSPNPREISRKLLTRGEKMVEVPFLNMLAAVWIQFQNHDWITHGENLSRELIEIPLPEDDPARKRYRQTKMFVGRTQPDPTRMPEGEETPVTFINEVTHWWDGSQIYGSEQQTVDHLRSGVDGKLRLNDDLTLPVGKNGVEETGMVRNWWVGLALLHNLFAREHNAICDMLKQAYAEWDDNRLFNVARLINAVVMAKIHSIEWTPAILPNRVLDAGLNANWYGLLTNLFNKGKTRKTVSDINVRNPEMGGVVGNPIDKHGSPFGLTEEFVEVYRLHSLLPETLEFRRASDDELIEEIAFVATRQAGSRKLSERIPMADLLYSFGNQHPGALILNNYPRFMQELSVPGQPLFDMGAIDILRARERGVPRYNEFRRQLGLNPIRRFEDLTYCPQVLQKLKDIYGDGSEDVEKLDLMVGTLAEAEEHRPRGFGFGETMFQIFILNATRRLQADRFYTDDYREEIYTEEGLEWIDRAYLKTVILRHHPELAKTGLGNVKNAFEPWDTDRPLDPARHRLRSPQVQHELLKRQGKIRFRKFNRNGAEHFNLRLYIKGDTGGLKSVTYELHPTFADRVRKVTNPTGGFRLDIWTWGEFDIDVTFRYRDGSTSSTTYPLEYLSRLPAEESAYIDETDPSIKGAS